MATTDLLGFNAVAENSLPGTPTKTIAWTNVNDAITTSDATYAEAHETSHTGPTFYAYWLEFTEPLAGSQVPAGSTITNILIEIRADADEPGVASVRADQGQIEPGASPVASHGLSGTIAWYTYNGDLTYWGLSNAEAMDFITNNGTAFKVYGTFLNSGGPTDAVFRMYNARCQITYTPPPRNRGHIS